MSPASPHGIGGKGRRPVAPGLAVLVVLLTISSAGAEPVKAPEKADAAGNPNYCANVASAAADARFRWQTDTLNELGKEIEGRIARLEAKRAEYETWLRRRQEFLAKASESVVAIYARMRPEAAALQLASMSSEAAAAILVRIDARIAGAILNEMEPARAALLTNTITDMPRATVPKPDMLKSDLPNADNPRMPHPPAGGDASPDPKSSEKTG